MSVEALGAQTQQRWQVLQRLPMAVGFQVVRLPEELWRYRTFTLWVNAAGRGEDLLTQPITRVW